MVTVWQILIFVYSETHQVQQDFYHPDNAEI